MPALITHHIFGEDVLPALPAGLIEGEEALLAFLLGNQGPDPLFARFSTLPSRAATCHRLARQIQGGRVTRTLLALRDGVAHLPRADERVGRAFALGVLGHYALDRAAHPFVIAQQRALCDVEPSLAARGREVHAVIESDVEHVDPLGEAPGHHRGSGRPPATSCAPRARSARRGRPALPGGARGLWRGGRGARIRGRVCATTSGSIA